MTILGIESTCDETGVAIVKDGTTIIKNVIVSSAKLHEKFGGIVPEVAAREQINVIIPAISKLIGQHQINIIDAIAVANGPGLIGSLLIGVETAKTLAVVWKKKLIAVNHLVGHVYANWLASNSKFPKFPLVALIVSGGHTDLVVMTRHNQFRHLGGTLDDACGETFDKVARALGLGYPGGPEIERLASQSFQFPVSSFQFPRPMIGSRDYDFSFSGLKTSVVNKIMRLGHKLSHEEISYIAFEFQNAVIDVLVTKTIMAAQKFNAKSIIIGGGVAANAQLRSQLKLYGSRIQTPVFYPEKNLSVDNGAMIAAAAFFTKNYVDPFKLSANPSLHF